MEIYIVLEEDVNTDNNINRNEIYVFNNIEEANKKVRKLRDNFFESVNIDDNFIIKDNTNAEESLYSFSAYEDGRYDNNHYSAIVYQREIN